MASTRSGNRGESNCGQRLSLNPTGGVPPTACSRPTLARSTYHGGQLPRLWTVTGFCVAPTGGAPPTACPRPTLQGPPYHAGQMPRFWTFDGFSRGVRWNGPRDPPGPGRALTPGGSAGTFGANLPHWNRGLFVWHISVGPCRQPFVAAVIQPGIRYRVGYAAVHDFCRLLIAWVVRSRSRASSGMLACIICR